MVSIFHKMFALLTRRRRGTFLYNHERPISPDFTRYYHHDIKFVDEFYRDLKRTVSWTEAIIAGITDIERIDYLRTFRVTNPIYEGRPFYIFNDDAMTASVPNVPFNYDLLLSEALMKRPKTVLPVNNYAELGRILRFEIDQTVYDGAPASELGFVDEADIPPIDTWFYITKKYLYCWIPALFIDKMQDAMDVEMLGSYAWLDMINPELNCEIGEKLSR